MDGVYTPPRRHASPFQPPPLTPLNAEQNTLMSAFNFAQAPLAPPQPPAAPADTIGFQIGRAHV